MLKAEFDFFQISTDGKLLTLDADDLDPTTKFGSLYSPEFRISIWFPSRRFFFFFLLLLLMSLFTSLLFSLPFLFSFLFTCVLPFLFRLVSSHLISSYLSLFSRSDVKLSLKVIECESYHFAEHTNHIRLFSIDYWILFSSPFSKHRKRDADFAVRRQDTKENPSCTQTVLIFFTRWIDIDMLKGHSYLRQSQGKDEDSGYWRANIVDKEICSFLKEPNHRWLFAQKLRTENFQFTFQPIQSTTSSKNFSLSICLWGIAKQNEDSF